MKLMVASFLILWSLSVNANAEPGVCAPDELNLGSGVNSVNTIFPRMMKTNLHYVFKKYSGTSGKCKSDEVQVTGPLFQEGFHNSKGEPIPLSALSTEVTVNPDGNQFCLKSSEFKREQTLAGSVFRTQIASGSGNEGTSFLLGGNVVMTNHHIAVAGNVPPACGGLKINANQDGKTWIPCKRILYCEPAPNDFCLVEMQPPLGKARVSDLVNKVKLNCSQVKEQPAKLIGNSALLGIQSADGPVHE
jgi:hypothetical protein